MTSLSSTFESPGTVLRQSRPRPHAHPTLAAPPRHGQPGYRPCGGRRRGDSQAGHGEEERRELDAHAGGVVIDGALSRGIRMSRTAMSSALCKNYTSKGNPLFVLVHLMCPLAICKIFKHFMPFLLRTR